ncbi:MAG: ScyD/ScyE family protein [Saprospiraceae bacterium]|nr:ScyD/ScyE family protein [Saprospiraceae bacterium]
MRTFFFLHFILVGNLVSAQTYTVVADSLRLPNGLEIDAQSRLWVVESGYGFDDGAVSILQPDGALLPVVVGLPAFFDTTSQESVGPWHTTALPNNRLGVFSPIDGGVLIFDLTGFVPGQSQPLTVADAVGSVIIADFVYQNQPPDMPDSNPYTGVVDANGNWYIADAGFNGIVKVDAAGQRSVLCKFGPIANPTPVGPPYYDAVPTRIIAKPGGGFYVSNLTGFPFLEGSASIFEVSPNGIVTTHATGFTMLTDLTLNANTGDLYALQIGTFDLSIFNFDPNSAKVWRLRPDGSREVIADNFDLSPGMALDGKGNLYVTELGLGRVLRFDGAVSATKEHLSDLTEFSLSPNPAVDFSRIDFFLKNASPVHVQVLDATGKLVFSQNFGALEPGKHELIWRRQNHPAGLYWVDIHTKTGVKTQKLILK